MLWDFANALIMCDGWARILKSVRVGRCVVLGGRSGFNPLTSLVIHSREQLVSKILVRSANNESNTKHSVKVGRDFGWVPASRYAVPNQKATRRSFAHEARRGKIRLGARCTLSPAWRPVSQVGALHAGLHF